MGSSHYEIRDNEGGFIDSFTITKYNLPTVDGFAALTAACIFTFGFWALVLILKLFWHGFLPLLWLSLKHLWGFGLIVMFGSIYFKDADPHKASLMLWGGFSFFVLIACMRILYAAGETVVSLAREH